MTQLTRPALSQLVVLAVAAVLGPMAPTAAAQGVTVGQRVRVTAPEAQIRNRSGALVAIDRSALTIGQDNQKWTIPMEQLTRLEVAGEGKGTGSPAC